MSEPKVSSTEWDPWPWLSTCTLFCLSPHTCPMSPEGFWSLWCFAVLRPSLVSYVLDGRNVLCHPGYTLPLFLSTPVLRRNLMTMLYTSDSGLATVYLVLYRQVCLCLRVGHSESRIDRRSLFYTYTAGACMKPGKRRARKTSMDRTFIERSKFVFIFIVLFYPYYISSFDFYIMSF